MIPDFYLQRYPFILHRCRWKYNLVPTIKSASFSFEPLSDAHLDCLVPLLMNPTFSGFYNEVREYKFKLKLALKYVAQRGGHFVVRSNSDNSILGEMIILEESKGKWEISYWLDSNLWGRGIMTDVVREFTSWVLENTALDSLYARCHENNLPSYKVLCKSGFVQEKRMDNFIFFKLGRDNKKSEI